MYARALFRNVSDCKCLFNEIGKLLLPCRIGVYFLASNRFPLQQIDEDSDQNSNAWHVGHFLNKAPEISEPHVVLSVRLVERPRLKAP